MPILKINPNIILGEGTFGINVETECLDTGKKDFLQITSEKCNSQAGENMFVLKLCKDNSKCINYKNEEILGKLLANDKKIPVTAIHKNLLYIIEEIELAESVKTLLAETLAIKAIKKGNQLNVSLFSRKALLMPYYNMDSLSEYIRFNKRGLNIDTIIIDDIFFAVRFLHSINCVHLDIKPENIMLHDSGQNNFKAVLIDYGLAQSIKEPINFGSGTEQYMSPELLSCAYGRRVLYNKGPDIWALGIVILEICMKQYSAWYYFYHLIKEFLADSVKKKSEAEQDSIIRALIFEKLYSDKAKSSIVNFTEFKQYYRNYYRDNISNITIAKNEYNIEEFLDMFFNLDHDKRIILYNELGYKSKEEKEQLKRINIDNTEDKEKLEEMIKKTTEMREDEEQAIESAKVAREAANIAVMYEKKIKQDTHSMADRISRTFSTTAGKHTKRKLDIAAANTRRAHNRALDTERKLLEIDISKARIEAVKLVNTIINTVINETQQNNAAEKMRRRVASMPEVDEESNVSGVTSLESHAVSRKTKRNIPHAEQLAEILHEINRIGSEAPHGGNRLTDLSKGGKTKRKRQIKRKFIQKTKGKKKKLSKKNRKPKNRKTQQKK